jgi:hypothetical protein
LVVHIASRINHRCQIIVSAGSNCTRSNSLYYHVRALPDAGLLLETHRSGEGIRITAYYDVPGRPLSVRFDLSTPSRPRAVLTLARTRIRSAARGFERACKPGVVTLEGPRRDLRVTHLKGWLSDKELEETNRLLERLVELVGNSERGATKGRRVTRSPSCSPPSMRPRARATTDGLLVDSGYSTLACTNRSHWSVVLCHEPQCASSHRRQIRRAHCLPGASHSEKALL